MNLGYFHHVDKDTSPPLVEISHGSFIASEDTYSYLMTMMNFRKCFTNILLIPSFTSTNSQDYLNYYVDIKVTFHTYISASSCYSTCFSILLHQHILQPNMGALCNFSFDKKN